MGNYYWNYNDCIQSDNLEAIELALTGILEQEGCHRISQLPPPPKDIEKESSNNLHKTVRDLWVIGLFVGAKGWTIIKTSPIELLCRLAMGASRSWLSELAMQIGCDAFHLSVYGGCEGILMEADARGRTFISGWTEEYGPQGGKFHSQQINEQEKPPQFFLLEVPEELQAATIVVIDYEERQRKLEKFNMLHREMESREREGRISDPQSEMEEWEEMSELYEQVDEFKSRFQLVDEALEQLLSGPHSYWILDKNPYCDHSMHLVYKAYTQQQQLEAEGARLLFFQPAEHYRQPDAGELKGAASNEVETDTQSEINDVP